MSHERRPYLNGLAISAPDFLIGFGVLLTSVWMGLLIWGLVHLAERII